MLNHKGTCKGVQVVHAKQGYTNPYAIDWRRKCRTNCALTGNNAPFRHV